MTVDCPAVQGESAKISSRKYGERKLGKLWTDLVEQPRSFQNLRCCSLYPILLPNQLPTRARTLNGIIVPQLHSPLSVKRTGLTAINNNKTITTIQTVFKYQGVFFPPPLVPVR